MSGHPLLSRSTHSLPRPVHILMQHRPSPPCHPSLAPPQLPSRFIHITAQKGLQWPPFMSHQSPPSPISPTRSPPCPAHVLMQHCSSPPCHLSLALPQPPSRFIHITAPMQKGPQWPSLVSRHPLLSRSLTHRPCPACVLMAAPLLCLHRTTEPPSLPFPASLALPQLFRHHSYKGRLAPCRPRCPSSSASLRHQTMRLEE